MNEYYERFHTVGVTNQTVCILPKEVIEVFRRDEHGGGETMEQRSVLYEHAHNHIPNRVNSVDANGSFSTCFIFFRVTHEHKRCRGGFYGNRDVSLVSLRNVPM
jgi:hypothetical protein